MRVTHRPRRAFTLIELLVVIAIFGVLLTMGVTAVFKVKLNGERKVELAAWKLARKTGGTCKRTTPFKILYIGNSYTFVNDLPALTASLAEAGNQAKIVTDSQLVGGATLEQHWNDGIALTKIQQGGWDFVVLQEQSMRPLLQRDLMHEYGKRFADEIKNVDAIPLLYQTWARQATPGTQGNLSAAYVTLADKVSGEVAPVGDAWGKALQQVPGLLLHSDDGSHPNPTGSYLAACVFYSVLYERSPEGLPGRLTVNGAVLTDVSDALAVTLQRIAWQTAQEMKTNLLRRRGLAR